VCVCVCVCVRARCSGIQFFHPLCSNLHKSTAENLGYEIILLPWCVLRSNYLVERKENREECLTLVLTRIRKKKPTVYFGWFYYSNITLLQLIIKVTLGTLIRSITARQSSISSARVLVFSRSPLADCNLFFWLRDQIRCHDARDARPHFVAKAVRFTCPFLF